MFEIVDATLVTGKPRPVLPRVKHCMIGYWIGADDVGNAGSKDNGNRFNIRGDNLEDIKAAVKLAKAQNSYLVLDNEVPAYDYYKGSTADMRAATQRQIELQQICRAIDPNVLRIPYYLGTFQRGLAETTRFYQAAAQSPLYDYSDRLVVCSSFDNTQDVDPAKPDTKRDTLTTWRCRTFEVAAAAEMARKKYYILVSIQIEAAPWNQFLAAPVVSFILDAMWEIYVNSQGLFQGVMLWGGRDTNHAALPYDPNAGWLSAVSLFQAKHGL